MNPPKIAYVLLWFPLSSETFIFREVVTLRRLGLPVEVYSLYGPRLRNCSQEMLAEARNVTRLGARALPSLAADLVYWLRRDSDTVASLFKEVPLRRWSCLEVAGESLWAFFAGFTLARRFEKSAVLHIHAPWANGPATAAWVASRLTGIPFSLAGRAGDIYPPDGALKEKLRDCLFARTNNRTNVAYLQSLAPDRAGDIHHVYNSLTLRKNGQSPVNMTPPYKLLAVGRFARTKGFDVLLRAAHILDKQGFPFHLSLVGAGFQKTKLAMLRKTLRLTDKVDMPGFVSHDRLTELLDSHDMLVVPSVVHATGDRDGIPNVIMEALSHRLPVVATDVCGIPEVVRHLDTGLVAPQHDPEALARAIREMASDRARAIAMAERGKALVMEMFDPEANAAKLFDLFMSQIGRSLGSR
ncbi:glycosyltransferase family 4 protein [Fundidesulfovibrio butyratiphilus]